VRLAGDVEVDYVAVAVAEVPREGPLAGGLRDADRGRVKVRRLVSVKMVRRVIWRDGE
jgi:hypothetical protein